MLRYTPIVLGILLIVGLTVVEARMSDRFQGSNFTAERFSKLLEDVPKRVGDWVGEDLPVDDATRTTAGAVGYVSRTYQNVRSNEKVKLWLIVGHSRNICRHTPNICYPSSGFRARAEHDSEYTMSFEGQTPADFLTNTFIKEDVSGRHLIRVFWSWYLPNPDGVVRWQAPDNPRWEFGNARALYKMYFSNVMRDPNETTDRSPCIRFAREFLPVVDKALSQDAVQEPSGSPATSAASTEETTS